MNQCVFYCDDSKFLMYISSLQYIFRLYNFMYFTKFSAFFAKVLPPMSYQKFSVCLLVVKAAEKTTKGSMPMAPPGMMPPPGMLPPPGMMPPFGMMPPMPPGRSNIVYFEFFCLYLAIYL